MPESLSIAPFILLIEDNQGDADLFTEFLSADVHPPMIVHVTRMSEAEHRLADASVDIVLLDLTLPDVGGIESVQRVRARVAEVPIVVLTGSADERLAMECIEAGASDYLYKSELRPHVLRRAIGYAMSRRNAQLVRELRKTIEGLRRLTNSQAEAPMTAMLAGVGPLRARQPTIFSESLLTYRELLVRYLDFLILGAPKPQTRMEVAATALGDADAGPRDLLDIHVAALEAGAEVLDTRHQYAQIVEGRMLALEMMGLLLDYYRSGHRRRSGGGQ